MSIQNQSFTNYEVLIIDGNSTDGTRSFLQTLQSPFHIISEADQGVYDAMNKGIDKAQGSWIYFMGSDDQFFESDVLASVFKDKIDSEVDLIVGNIKYDCDGKEARHLNRNDDIRKSKWSSQLWLTNSVHHQGVFYRHSVFEAKRYNLRYKILADYDLNLWLFRQGKSAKMIDKVIAFCGANGLSKTYNWRMYQEEIRLKTSHSSMLLKPLFYVLALSKYILKQMQK